MIEAPDFEALYRADPDPWRVDTSWYERRKLGVVLASLGRSTYASAWDPACGTGHLAAALADRAGEVLATDLSRTAVTQTARRCRDLDTVRTACLRLPDPPTTGTTPDGATPLLLSAPDLIVVSEFFYYLTDHDRAATIALLDRVAGARCELVAVHWRHVPDDAWLGGAGAQQEIVSRFSALGWLQRLHHDDEEFVIDTLRRGDDR